MTIREVLKKYNNIEIELLLAHVLKKPKEFVYLHPKFNLTTKQLNNLASLVKRRENGEPIAYILGYKDFCGLRFKVNKYVLIPRPETEWLVERVKSLEVRGKKILDLATGSGCIAISAGKFLQTDFKNGTQFNGRYKVSRTDFDEFKITASDISAKALSVAKQNAKMHKATVKFILSDLFSKIEGKFDVVVANLPYVPIGMMKKYVLGQKLEPTNPFSSLKFEPQAALTDGTKSFQLYRRFFEQVGGHINPKSLILLEIDPSSRKYIKEYQKKYLPRWQTKFYKDFNHLWRYAEIKSS